MTRNLLQYENDFYEQGYELIAGVDEAGCGPLCGPVVAACVILPRGLMIEGVDDSKKLTPQKREELAIIIKRLAIDYNVAVVDAKTIDQINILEASRLAMNNAIKGLKIKPDFVLTDHMRINDYEHLSVVKGDQKSLSIAAASIIAKTYRDQYMIDLDQKYPMYDLVNNKGYGTKKHIEAINQYGIINEHRKSFAPIKNKFNVK